jgi:hypothetical protein
MAEIDDRANNPIDLRRDNIEDAEAQVDASALALAKVFGTAAFPSNMPDFLKEAILARADQARNAAGDLVIDNRMDASDPKSRREREEDTADFVSQWVQNQQQMQADREREEWAHAKSTVGGVTMTGAEWAAMAKRLREDDKLREEILGLFRRRGMTDEEAERRYQRVINVAEIAAIPSSQRTEEQQHEFEKAKADPSFARDMHEAESLIEKDSSRQLAAVGPNLKTKPEARNIAIIDGPLI